MSHRSSLRVIAAAALLTLVTAGHVHASGRAGGGCAAHRHSADRLPADTAREWMQAVMDRVKAEGLVPPHAARVYAYAGVTLYEGAEPAMHGTLSLAGRLNGLSDLPKPAPCYDVIVAQAEATSRVLAVLFADKTASLDAFETLRARQVADVEASGVASDTIAAGQRYGEEYGAALVGWISGDGYAETRGLAYVPPVGPQYWVPTGSAPASTLPLEPYWGTLRPFALRSHEQCAPPPPVEFSDAPGSAMHEEASTVYSTVQGLTSEQSYIAKYWADGPATTYTPPGHWISIFTQLAADRSLGEASRGYALVGVAVGDAFISCWQTKFRYSLLRPETYITRHIDPAWKPYIPTPMFPEYTSGHSTSSGAASAVLAAYFGDIPFIDETHAAAYGTRAFPSFRAAAEEAAVSRLYGGIHYIMGNENGLAQGRCIGRVVNRIAVGRSRRAHWSR